MSFDHAVIIGFYARMTDSDSAGSPSASGLSPEALIARIAMDRDRKAYAALFTRFAPRIKAFVMGQGLTAQEAEDLAQDAMLNVWRKAHLFDPEKAHAVTWIYSIARNLRIDLARKAKRARDLPEDLWQPEPQPTADQGIIASDDTRSIVALLQTLPSEQQTVLKLSFYENLSHGDIAKALAIPLGTVKSRMRLALARLRTGLVHTGERE